MILGVGEGLVDVEKADALRSVISLDRLQPGDVTQKGSSGQTTQDQHRVLPPDQVPYRVLRSVQVVNRNLGQRFADLRCRALEALIDSLERRVLRPGGSDNQAGRQHYTDHAEHTGGSS
jgi:hypothetical protein